MSFKISNSKLVKSEEAIELANLKAEIITLKEQVKALQPKVEEPKK